MSEIKGPGGELRATIHITRKETGKVETYELVGRTSPEQHAEIMEAINSGRLNLEDLKQVIGGSAEIRPKRIEHGASGALVGPGANINKED